MFKSRSIGLLMPLLMVLSMLMSTPAMAQNTQTWMPAPENFNPAVHSYLDPKLAGSVDLSGCEQQLKDAGKVHGYEYYFIMTELDSEPNGSTSGQNFAAWKLDQYVLKISSKLPADKYVIVLVVRSRKNPSAHSLAAQGGDVLQKEGFNSDWFNAPAGTLANNKSVYLPVNPKGFILAVVGDVNKRKSDLVAEEVRKQKQAEAERLERERQAEAARLQKEKEAQEAKLRAERAAAEAEAHAAFMRVLPFYIFGGLFTTLLLVFAVYRQILRGKALALIADRKKKLASSNDFSGKLRRDYYELLKDRKNWRDMFNPAGVTYAKYEEAVDAYSEFTVRNEIANKLVEDAESLVKGCPLWSFSGYKKAVALFETTPVVVTGEEIQLKDVKDIFGGKLRSKTYQPATLLDSMQELFDKANTGLSSVFKSFADSDKNRADIERLFAKLDETKALLAGNDLVFEPYKARYEELKESQTRALATVDSDPLAAVESTQAVEDGIQALDQTIERALDFRRTLAKETEPALAQSENRVKVSRSQPVQYLYPLAAGETVPESLREAKLLLAEEGANPDLLLADANRFLTEALNAVRDADLQTAALKKASAQQSAEEATKVAAAVLETKSYVEKQLPPVRTALNQLTAALPSASKAVTELKAEFLPQNFKDEPKKLEDAQSVADSTGNELSKLKRAYDEQRYLAARALLDKLSGNLNSSAEQLHDIHARLERLRQLKAQSRTTVKSAEDLSGRLADKLRLNGFTTAAETDSAYERLKPSLAAQKADVGQDITDWPAAAREAEQLLTSFQQIDRSVDEQKSQHDNAKEAVSKLSTAVDNAFGFVRDRATLQPAIDKLEAAKKSQTTVQANIARAKSNWAGIARQANEAAATAAKAEELAKADRKNYDDAVASVSALKTALRNASGYTHDPATRQAALDKLSEANTALSEAQSKLDKPKSDWSAIASQAKAGTTAAQKSEALAKTDRQDYDKAETAIRSLSAAINQAQVSVDDSTTRQTAVNTLNQARTTLKDVQAKFRQPRSDWSNIAGLATTAVNTANEAARLAQADRQAYDRAVAAINGASKTIRESRTQFDRNVHADLGSAKGKLQSARTALDSGNYENASSYAQSVDGLVAAALTAAAEAVAAIVAREQKLEQERQQKLADERAQQLAQEQQAARERQAARDQALQQAALEQAAANRRVSQPERQPESLPERTPNTSTPDRNDDTNGRSGSGVDGGGGRSGKGVGDF